MKSKNELHDDFRLAKTNFYYHIKQAEYFLEEAKIINEAIKDLEVFINE